MQLGRGEHVCPSAEKFSSSQIKSTGERVSLGGVTWRVGRSVPPSAAADPKVSKSVKFGSGLIRSVAAAASHGVFEPRQGKEIECIHENIVEVLYNSQI